MITATRNGATKDFTETCWGLLPDDKCGWSKVPPAPPIEVAEVAKAERIRKPFGDNPPARARPAAVRPQPSTLNPSQA